MGPTPDVVAGHDSAYIRRVVKLTDRLVILPEFNALLGDCVIRAVAG